MAWPAMACPVRMTESTVTVPTVKAEPGVAPMTNSPGRGKSGRGIGHLKPHDPQILSPSMRRSLAMLLLEHLGQRNMMPPKKVEGEGNSTSEWAVVVTGHLEIALPSWGAGK